LTRRRRRSKLLSNDRKDYDNHGSDLPDKGVQALMATGLVPPGAKFLTNMSQKPIEGLKVDPEKVRAEFERKGYEVTVIPNVAFDKRGRSYKGADAWVGIKKQK